MGGVTIEESDDERSIVTPNCRLTFRWTGERWVHTLAVGPSGALTFAESVEAEADRDDFRRVPSPTFQDLHFQETEYHALAMLVGQFGSRHFSAAITVSFTPARDDMRGHWPDSTDFRFDIADRSREPTEFLACTYRLRDPWGPASHRDGNTRQGWTVSEPAWKGYVGLSLGTDRTLGGAVDISDTPRAGTQIRLSRTLQSFQANGRLEFQWFVQDQGPRE